MRIAYLTSKYPSTSHTFIRREVSALRDLGVSVETFSVRPPEQVELVAEVDRREAAETYTILARPLGDFAAAHLRSLFGSPATYLRTLAAAIAHRPPGVKSAVLAIAHFGEAILLAAELKRRGIDHLHNHFANSGATVGWLASRHAAIGWSFTIHGISEFDYPGGLLLDSKIRDARFVACVSYFGRAQAMRLANRRDWPKLHIVRCGIEIDRLPAITARDDGRVQLIFVGRLSSEKGIAGLIEAFAATASPLLGLTIVGDGPLGPELRGQVERAGLSPRVRFAGRLPEADTLAAIAQSDILVLPSFMEGLPIVLMEALALGKPVIASRVAGIPELVRDGETGLLFDPSDWGELTSAIDRLAADPDLCRHMGEQGPRRIAEEFDVNRSAATLRDLFALAQSAAIPTALPGARGPGTSGLSTERRGAV
jgi:colanic acid/amylovoran biosynthesis glycosyltransferase